ncbi:hypothetical protein CONPUDRAFT_160556 [Coniophora puteana RWD-64-598 SS2]|uniref:Uncharacterized protein n=1 Tax=Coniophora puteana (strain RWD-64-598) TaxID=741705 RepID=R7SCN3_CONPW|nr:uncharacterized protein CONPUDRAFT_160556 [Coniophora puteana RWD-64-598 SS2]EIW73926.1 hypothetical protein CONPUDRAFT_160556 [Coniophora puteana RWD-64-598 SS2]
MPAPTGKRVPSEILDENAPTHTPIPAVELDDDDIVTDSDSELATPGLTGTKRRKNLDLTFTPRRAKRLKTFGRDLCNEAGISEKALDSFTSLPSLDFMMVAMYARFEKVDAALQNNGNMKLRQLLEDANLRKDLNNNILLCLLSPYLPAYVTGTLDHFTKFVCDNESIFKIPKEMFDDYGLRATLSRAIGKFLDTHRYNMKEKLTASCVNTTNILTLSKNVADKIEINMEYLTRIAFLRFCFRLHSILCKDVIVESNPSFYCPLFDRYIPDVTWNWLRGCVKGLPERVVEVEHVSETASPSSNADGPTEDQEDGQESPDRPDFSYLEEEQGDSSTIAQNKKGSSNEDTAVGPLSALLTAGKFWNFVDWMLTTFRNEAHERSKGSQIAFNNDVKHILTNIFTQDLVDYSNSSLPYGISKEPLPPKQLLINEKLIW